MCKIKYQVLDGFSKYRIGSDGSIWSFHRKKPKKLAIGSKTKSPYIGLILIGDDGNQYATRVHLVILEVFCGPAPKGLCARHLNGNKRDNRLKNLRWGTYKQNTQDRWKHNTMLIGERHQNSLLTEEQVIEARKKWKYGDSLNDIALYFCVARNTIHKAIIGRTWGHVPGVCAKGRKLENYQ